MLAPQVQVQTLSPIYETSPWGFPDQPSFLNQVLEVKTDLAPLDLLSFIKRIEESMGRKPNFVYGPRLIDLDILIYDDQVINLPSLVIPHPHLAERAFVLVPLGDIAPELKLPVFGQTASELLIAIGRDGVFLYQE